LKGGAPPPPAAPTEAVKSEGSAAEREPSAEAGAEAPGEEEEAGGRRGRDSDRLTGITNGHNRVSWNLRVPEAKRFPGMVMWAGGTLGPRVMPGAYTVRLTVGDQPPQTAAFDLRPDPRASVSAADLKAQYDFVMNVHDKLSQVNEQITRIRDVRRSLTDIKKRAGDNKTVVNAANDLDKKMTTVEEALYQTKNHSPEDPLNFPIRLNDKLAGVGDSAGAGAFPPTAQQIAVRDALVAQIDAELAKLKAIFDTDLPAFNKLIRDQNVPAIK
ncbi:MAG TPA: glycosyl hydrolase, partial [Thermoanaerobaculia bacterium]|nr:glycosyl hydrolase [Thermoanaerobaculia bacterium]